MASAAVLARAQSVGPMDRSTSPGTPPVASADLCEVLARRLHEFGRHAQSRALEVNVDDFFDWHRRSELPRYALFLDRVANDAVRPVSLAQLEAGQREVDRFMSDSVAHVAPAAAGESV